MAEAINKLKAPEFDISVKSKWSSEPSKVTPAVSKDPASTILGWLPDVA